MAWELQRHMHGRVAPSILKTALLSDDGEEEYLIRAYADQLWNEELVYEILLMEANTIYECGSHLLLEKVAEFAIEVSTTTNGGGEVWLNREGCTSIPWCSDDEYEEWNETGWLSLSESPDAGS